MNMKAVTRHIEMTVPRHIFATFAMVAVASMCEPSIAQAQSVPVPNTSAWLDCLKVAETLHPVITSPEREKANAECTSLYGDKMARFRANRPAVSDQDFFAMQEAAEGYLRGQLIDPQSAVFEWPRGFYLGEWKPLLRKRVGGYITCGYVNAKNRMGGYAGRSAFVVVMDGPNVKFADIGKGDSIDLVQASCDKSASLFPPPPVRNDPVAASSSTSPSVAGELSQLAALMEKGLITREEFEAQKRKLLAQ